MGIINHTVKLGKLVNEFNLKNFVESGTGTGDSMKVVVNGRLFKNYYGIELEKFYIEQLEKTFEDEVKFYNGYSKDEMENVLDDLDTCPTLFWLDAHFPGSDYKHLPYDSIKDETIRIPLEIELEIISKTRDISKDIFIIDDLRVYKDGDYEDGGPWVHRKTAGAKNCDFIEKLIGKTHILVEHYRDQGYIIAFPIDSKESAIKSTIVWDGEY